MKHSPTSAQAEVAFIEAEAAVAAIKRRGYEVLPPLKQVCICVCVCAHACVCVYV
jgi:hypothetical protein